MFIENEEGFVLVANEKELDEFVKMAGWESIEAFEQEHGIKKEELFGKEFVTVRGSISFKE